MQAEVVRDQASAEAVRLNVAREEAAVAQTAMEAKALATEAKADLAQALPALQAAVDSLNALNKGTLVLCGRPTVAGQAFIVHLSLCAMRAPADI